MASLERGALTELLVLALESATAAPAVALLEGERTVALRAAGAGDSATAFLLPAVEAVLAEAGALLSRVGLFALAIGPGSFTGLRVGLATVQGLAFGTDVLAAPVSSLSALALAAGSGTQAVAALLDARRGDVYAAAFGPGDAVVLPEGLYRAGDLAARLPRGCRWTGDGGRIHEAALAAAGHLPAAEGAFTPVEAVGRLGLRIARAGRAQPPGGLAPRYLRRAEAEARRTGEPLEPKNPF